MYRAFHRGGADDASALAYPATAANSATDRNRKEIGISTATGLLALIGGVGLVVWAADVFVDGLLGVGRRLGVAPFVLTVALSGFETENLAAGIATNAKGLPGAAAGTFLGGVVFLALAVAGIGGLIAPMRVELPPRFAAWTALAPLPLFGTAVDGRISRAEGALLLVWFAIALVGAARTGRALLAGETEEQQRRPVARLVVGLGVLTGGGWLLGEGLRTVVRHLGIPQTLLGNTALAATTEAEELARVAVPARRGRPELALGNIAGTIIHFAAFNAGVIALVKPLTLDHVTTRLYLPAATAAPAIFATVLLARRRIGRLEGAALLAVYACYLAAAIAAS
jgi:cation:H+ antiporter